MLPRLDGLEVCKRLRAESTVPIIMLTARDDELDKVLGLELGADDYITKPFSIREFRSRVRALLRRAAAPRPASADDDEVIEAGELRIDVPRRTVEVRGERGAAHVRRVRAAADARRGARAACSRAGSCSSGSGAAPTTASRARSTCTCAICARRSSANPHEPELILTVRGVGYRFRERVRCGARDHGDPAPALRSRSCSSSRACWRSST